MLTSREYEEKRGCYCPVCGSEDMEGERVESHDGGASQEVTCNSCGSSWTDLYSLSGYVGLEDNSPST